MNILITGANGFLGSSILKEIDKKSNNVAILVREKSNIKKINNLLKNVVIYKFSELHQIDKLLSSFRPDVIIHTACCYDIGDASKEEIYSANYYYGKTIIESILKNEKKTYFLNAASSMPEELNLYTESKQKFSKYCLSMIGNKNLFFINVVIQFFYGKHDKKTSFVMNLIRACISGEKKFNLTSGKQKRDFVHIDDVISAYLVILKNLDILKNNSVIEIGSGESISIKDFSNMIKRLTLSEIFLDFNAIPLRMNEPNECVANIKFLKKLGWSPLYNVNDGIKLLIKEIPKD